MNIKTRVQNMEMTPAIEEYVYKKLQSIEKFIEKKDVTLCEVELGKTTTHHRSGPVFKAEVNLNTPGGNQFYAVAEEEDLYAAIDIVRDKIERDITSDKKKRFTLFRKGGAKVKALLKRLTFRK